jgi:hypothetical protein
LGGFCPVRLVLDKYPLWGYNRIIQFIKEVPMLKPIVAAFLIAIPSMPIAFFYATLIA